MQSQNFKEIKFPTNRLPKQGSYEWMIKCIYANSVEVSENFYPLGSENQWYFTCEKQGEIISVQFRSLKKTDDFVNLEFFLNRERLPISHSGCLLGNYTIAEISTKNGRPFNPVKMGRKHAHLFTLCEISYGTLKVVWSWGKMHCRAENLSQELLLNMHTMLESGKFSDIIIETKDGSKIPVHRNVLSARCPVFRAMLENDMLEARTQCIKITDFFPETVKNMVNYLYTSKTLYTTGYSFDSTTDLLRIADKYDLSSLKSICAETLIANVSENNAIELLLLADMHSSDGLKAKALEFISENRSFFEDRNKLNLLKQHPELLIDVTISVSKNR